jgi:ABC-type transport system involved in cytochrome c biogenesis permease subunit
VTNLYSSAVFVSWAAVPLCLLLEKRYLNGIASAAAALLGFATLIIAHHLSFSGDTMEMMRAVLDSNFWLATHVPTVTIGYSATFLAGFIALIYIIRDRLFGGIPEETGRVVSGMVYGTVCFALLFSFVGTVLGGIWADQSWGRFWGWDPKENGALMIVLWNALILHARWAKIATTTAIMQLAIFGNIITAWSWFGTNMLGVGLHSYGFMDAAFFWLLAFIGSQLFVICLPYLRPRAGAA